MMDQAGTTYPSNYETDYRLKDGSVVLLRPARVEDAERWLSFVQRLSMRTKYLRFQYVAKEFGLDDAIRFCTVDYHDNFAFVAETARADVREIVGFGGYYRLPARHAAEVALVVEDGYQDKGIGTALMRSLVAVAREQGIRAFEADVLSENRRMMSVFRSYGFHVLSMLEEGVYHVTFPISPTRKTVKREQEMERVSTIASLRSILAPRSVAIVGASRRTGNIGRQVLQCIVQSGFTGTVYPVNPHADAVMSVKAYPSVLDIPGEVDLAVIAVPAQIVPRITDECGRKEVRTIAVISDGFREIGHEGRVREKELRDMALGHGMRLLGPNCMGVINTDPAVRLNATFSHMYPPKGSVGILSQSGAVGLVILEHAASLGMGVSSFVSIGNRADISPDDLLQYWEQDKATRYVLLYLESFGDPRKFSRFATRVSAMKPIVAVKSGTTFLGSLAASSHTGVMATPEAVSDAFFRQTGIIKVDAVRELFDMATLLSSQPLPGGRRLVVVTNGGGPGIIAADAAARCELGLPGLSQETVGRLRSVVKRDMTLRNPVDITDAATAEEFGGVLKVLGADRDCDSVLAICVPHNEADARAMEEAIRGAASSFRRTKKPLLVCFMGHRAPQARLCFDGGSLPCYPFPEEAVAALGRAVGYAEWLKKPKGSIPRIQGLRRAAAARIVERVMRSTVERPVRLPTREAIDLLTCYGIRFVDTVFARSADEAASLAPSVGFPVAVKLMASSITYKSNIGGVILGLRSKQDVKQAYREIEERLRQMGRRDEMEGVMVQRMVRGGIETMVGVTQDPSFGPLIMFGLGGIYTDLIQDVAVRIHPLTDLDAGELVSSIRIAKLFQGFGDSAPSDTGALEDLLLRISALVEDVPQIADVELNPVKVMARDLGYWVLDAKIMLR
jgi:acetyl coenzyme A synthetase (ADP forming)-like protein